MYLFSASTFGFYDPNINTNIPTDTMEITNEQYEALLAGQSSGQVISSDVSGNPVLDNPEQ